MTEEVQIENTTEEKTRRRPRSLDSRSFDTRKSKERSPLSYQTESRYNLPLHILEDDPEHEYGWVVYSLNNYDHNENFYQARESGWDPVLSSMHPELSRIYAIDATAKEIERQYLRRGGQILMKRHRDLTDKENMRYRIEIENQRKRIDRAREKGDDDTAYYSDHRFPDTFSPIPSNMSQYGSLHY